jgi:D-2-hydroxyglutarate dehydrogenase
MMCLRGNTGLVGGSVPIKDEVIMSMELMNDIVSLDTHAGVLVCEVRCSYDVHRGHL